MKVNRESSPPAKRSRPADGHSRRVTFNPNVQERALHPVSEPPKPVTLKEAADIVVRYLDPFYTQGKFATKVRDISNMARLQKRKNKKKNPQLLPSLGAGAVQVLCPLLVSPPRGSKESGERPR